MKNTFTVFLAGGSGSRLWPLSTKAEPKQFQDVLGMNASMLRLSVNRFASFCLEENFFIATNAIYQDLAQREVPEIPLDRLILEPIKKNTASCVAYAAFKIHKRNPDAILIITPSDQLISSESNFATCIKESVAYAETHNTAVVIGIKPHLPETSYSYVQYRSDKPITEHIYHVKTYTENPTEEIATTFLQSGEFLWNSGITVIKVSTLIETYLKLLPEMHSVFKNALKHFDTPQEIPHMKKAYPICENVSFRAGILYRMNDSVVFRANFGWANLVNWHALWSSHDKDYMGNAVSGKHVMMYDAANCVVKAPDNKLVIINGLEDFIVVDKGNMLLIMPRNRENELENLLADQKLKNGDKFV